MQSVNANKTICTQDASQGLGDGKWYYRVDNICTLEMRAHHSHLFPT